MNVKYGNNGIIYCNTVRYNYKQARNMIADGSYGNISGSNVWKNIQAADNGAGYKTYRAIKVTNSNMTEQKLPKLTSGHKYYFSCWYKTSDVTNCFLGLRNNTTDLVSVFNGVSTNWKLASTVYSCTADIANGTGNVCIWVPSGTIYTCKFILIDLTVTFGSGKEPTKDWCDNNIREQEVITNFGNVANHVTYSNINSRYPATGLTKQNHNYLSMDGGAMPRDYLWQLIGLSSNTEGYLYSDNTISLTPSNYYYGYIEINEGNVTQGQSFDMYWPEAEPKLGNVPSVINRGFNSGGSGGYAAGWKRVSFYNHRNSFSSGKYKLRFDFNNNKQTNGILATAINLLNVSSSVNIYNQYNGTSITVNDINKEWCDRWIDGRSSPFIHIKDPYNTSIKFQPFKQVKRDKVYDYTRANLNSWVGSSNDGWGTNNTANTHLKVGDFAYIDCLISDENNKKARFYLQIVSVTASTVYANNLAYYDETQEGYNIPVDIVCNDIEIRPETNKITFDKTGTIKCKKLIRTQPY